MSNALFPHVPLICKNMMADIDWATSVKSSSSGRETSLSKRMYPLWKFTLPFDRLYGGARGNEYEVLAGFINARRGRSDDFLFKNPRDHLVANQGFGVGNGAKKDFEIVRALGGFSEPVGGVDAASLVVKVGGVATTAYTLNALLNTVSFVTAPAAGAVLTWSGTFYFRCRFTKDNTRFKQFVRDIYDTDIEFKSFRP